MDINQKVAKAEHAIRELLEFIGEDPFRAGLVETPHRVVKAWLEEWGRGYRDDLDFQIKMFEQEEWEPRHYDEMVVQKGIRVMSMCEHHMAPFFGTAVIGYIPSTRIINGEVRSVVVGLSKLARIVDHFSRRLQVQERLTNQIAEYIFNKVCDSKTGCGVVIRAQHMCMVSRGVQQSNTETITSAMRGHFFSDPRARAEFLKLAND